MKCTWCIVCSGALGALLFFAVNSLSLEKSLLGVSQKLQDQITIGLGKDKLDRLEYAGYVNNLFYWYTAAQAYPEKAPLIIWTSGGPGTSSLYGLFKENGPYEVIQNNAKLQLIAAKNHTDWSQFAHYLVIDQPLGVGLSFASDKKLPATPAAGNEQYLKALQAFFARHPDLLKKDIYLAGESYGGTYIALLAEALMNKTIPGLELKGLIVVSGWIAPRIQYQAIPEFAYQNGLIDLQQLQQAQVLVEQCLQCDDRKQNCYSQCDQIDQYIREKSQVDLHHISQTSDITNDWQKGPWVDFLNQKSTRFALHISDTGLYHPMRNIWDNYGKRQLDSVLPVYSSLLRQKIQLLVVSGMKDASPSGVAGTEAWLRHLFPDPEGLQKMGQGRMGLTGKECQVSGADIDPGSSVMPLQLLEQVRWIRVCGAGHTVPVDYPGIAEAVKVFVQQ